MTNLNKNLTKYSVVQQCVGIINKCSDFSKELMVQTLVIGNYTKL